MKRNTHQQQIVFNTVWELKGKHPTADELHEYIKPKMPSISRATVYRILNQFVSEKKLQKILVPSGADIYDCRLDTHLHIRCNNCGRTMDTDIPVIKDFIDILPKSPKYTITGYDIVFNGLCAECTMRKAAAN